MINHIRTLLMNHAPVAVDNQLGHFLSGEIIDPDFTPLVLTSSEQRLYRLLYGNDPDLAGLNYRTSVYLSLVSAARTKQFVTALDPRITYERELSKDLFYEIGFTPRLSWQLDQPLHWVRMGAAEDQTGRVGFQYTVRITDSVTAQVSRISPPRSETSQTFTTTDGLSSPVTLPGSGYAILFPPVVGAIITADVLNRPRMNPPVIVDAIATMPTEDLGEILGIEETEPWLTFRNLWQKSPYLPERLGGILCAYVYRLEARRRG